MEDDSIMQLMVAVYPIGISCICGSARDKENNKGRATISQSL
ncbi:hypothetical protein COLO4_30299 [Corchorus olitorius]|uniref:Uncharacterized protein n=1 Tax=Corchorus olitorius TaxID=93759 RepID=A0A1R3H9B7_9ROSI|nr:hypothetical protein COLO4_30299 [Corchorus olitorius]